MAEASAATARRVIYSSYVVPQEALVLEEGDATVGQLKKYAIEGGAGRTYGGKGIVTGVPIDVDLDSQLPVSFLPQSLSR